MMTSRREQLSAYVILYLFALFAVLPLASAVLVAFNRPSAPVSGVAWPSPWTFSSFISTWSNSSAGVGRSLLNSFILAMAVVPVSVLLSIFTGYAFGTMKFRGRKLLFGFLVFGLMFPYEATVIPLYFEFRKLNLLDTYWSMILPDIGGSMSFGTFWMTAFFRGFPRELLESARTEGAGRWKTLWQIVVPTAGAPLFALATILFIWTWNNLLLAIVMIQSPSRQMAPAALNFFVGAQYGSNYQFICAAAIIVALPVMIIYYVLQRRYGTDVLAGALKG